MDETLAVVLIKAELGTAKQVAEAAAVFDAVQWTIVVTGDYDVIVAIKVKDNAALGTLVVDDLQQIAGVKDLSTHVVAEKYYGTLVPLKGLEGFP
jgi:DNA-binding Lrp family transcriptional regulator